MPHAITSITLIEPDGIDWACACGTTGRCPRPVAAHVLAEHLADPRRSTDGGDIDARLRDRAGDRRRYPVKITRPAIQNPPRGCGEHHQGECTSEPPYTTRGH